jgi:hypothetical protein
MGATRGGWYSYDAVDNGGRSSSDRILPQFQEIGCGTLFPATPGATDTFILFTQQAPNFLVLGVRSPNGVPVVTRTFELRQTGPSRTRLVVRVRGSREYEFHGLPMWLVTAVVPLIHFIMERKQLLGIRRRAEQYRRGNWNSDISVKQS